MNVITQRILSVAASFYAVGLAVLSALLLPRVSPLAAYIATPGLFLAGLVIFPWAWLSSTDVLNFDDAPPPSDIARLQTRMGVLAMGGPVVTCIAAIAMIASGADVLGIPFAGLSVGLLAALFATNARIRSLSSAANTKHPA